MANIKKYLDNIKGALYGKDVRGSIYDGLDAINKEIEGTTGRQVDLEKTFDQLVINAGNSNAEIVDARVKSDGTSYPKLGDRLNEVDSQLEHNTKLLDNIYINVKNFGAKGDGVSDDTESIKLAYEYALNNKGILYFPLGTFIVSDTLKLKNNTVIEIKGEIKLKEQSNCNIFENYNKEEGNSNIKIQGGILNINRDNQTDNSLSICFYKCNKIELVNIAIIGSLKDSGGLYGACHLQECSDSTIRNMELSNASEEGLYLVHCQNISVIGGYFHDNYNGSGVGTHSGTKILIDGVRCINNAGANISINSTHSKVIGSYSSNCSVYSGIMVGHDDSDDLKADGTVVIGCHSENNNGGGITVGNGVNCVLSDNVILNNNSEGIRLTGSSYQCLIKNNVINKNSYGIMIYSPEEGNIIEGNTISENTLDGININGKNNIIKGNTVKNNGQGEGTFYGIKLHQAITKNNIISENIVIDTQNTPTQNVGIHTNGEYNTIVNNVVKGNATEQVYANTTNLIRGNRFYDDPFMVEVVLTPNSTTTRIENKNIRWTSAISFLPIGFNTQSRNVYLNRIVEGAVEFTHTSSASTEEKIRVFIL